MSVGATRLRAWWREPVDYRWLLSTLRRHSALGLVKLLVGTGGLGLCAIAILISLSPEGPRDAAGRMVLGAVAAAAAMIALRWCALPWPSAAMSLVTLAGADIGITVACLLVSNRVAMIGATLLIFTGGYLTFFHSAKVLAVHAGWSLLSVLAVTARMLTHGGPESDALLAMAIGLIMLLAIVVVLPSLQFFYWVLRTDALSDPLTALLNRRGLEYHLPRLFECGKAVPICAITVDLDRFKLVNDTFGHQAGDEVLARTAQRLRAAADSEATVARTGGEEFTIVDHLDADSARVTAERLRSAVEESTDVLIPVTASIGVAVFDDRSVADGCPHPSSERLLHCADTAMYQAKQQGGNTVVVQELRRSSPAVHR